MRSKGPIVGLKDRRKEEGEEDRETTYSIYSSPTFNN